MRRRRRRRNPKHEKLLRQARKRYDELVTLQGSETCWICGVAPKTRRLHIDHDHRTMELRGLLCFNCNSLLRPRWSANTLRRAADYLEDPPLKGVMEKERAAISDDPSSGGGTEYRSPPLADIIHKGEDSA